MTSRDQAFEVLRQEGFRLYDKRDDLEIKQRRLTTVTDTYQRLVSQIRQETEETAELCKGSRWANPIGQEATKSQPLRRSNSQILNAYEASLKAETKSVQALIDKNVQAKANLFNR